MTQTPLLAAAWFSAGLISKLAHEGIFTADRRDRGARMNQHDRVVIPERLLVQQLNCEAVILDLDSGTYFGSTRSEHGWGNFSRRG